MTAVCRRPPDSNVQTRTTARLSNGGDALMAALFCVCRLRLARHPGRKARGAAGSLRSHGRRAGTWVDSDQEGGFHGEPLEAVFMAVVVWIWKEGRCNTLQDGAVNAFGLFFSQRDPYRAMMQCDLELRARTTR